MRDPDFQDGFDYTRFEGGAHHHHHHRRQSRNIWQKLSTFVEVIIYILIVLLVLKWFHPEFVKQRELQNELEQLEAVRQERATKVARLRHEHLHLKSDREYLETVARDRLNLYRKGEYVIQIER